MCYKEPAIRGVMSRNYVFKCGEQLAEIREISVLLRNPRGGGKDLAKEEERKWESLLQS